MPRKAKHAIPTAAVYTAHGCLPGGRGASPAPARTGTAEIPTGHTAPYDTEAHPNVTLQFSAKTWKTFKELTEMTGTSCRTFLSDFVETMANHAEEFLEILQESKHETPSSVLDRAVKVFLERRDDAIAILPRDVYRLLAEHGYENEDAILANSILTEEDIEALNSSTGWIPRATIDMLENTLGTDFYKIFGFVEQAMPVATLGMSGRTLPEDYPVNYKPIHTEFEIRVSWNCDKNSQNLKNAFRKILKDVVKDTPEYTTRSDGNGIHSIITCRTDDAEQAMTAAGFIQRVLVSNRILNYNQSIRELKTK